MELLTFQTDAFFQFVLLAAFLVPAIFFLRTQQLTLKRIRLENRKIRPVRVWFQLIPVFGQLFQIFVVTEIAGSIKKEMVARHSDTLFGGDVAIIELGNNRPTLAIGLAYCLLNIAGIGLSVFADWLSTAYAAIDMAVRLLLWASIACWIVYWVQLAGWKRRLKQRAGLATD